MTSPPTAATKPKTTRSSSSRTIKAHPKVRTGCWTCKKRRVKCDETKPECKRCVSTGRNCDGYPADKIRQVDAEALSDPRELRSFHYYKDKTASQLSGYFDNEFWNSVVLRTAESSPAIKHSLVAIGALHEALDISYSTWLHDLAEPIQLFALEQYNQSIAMLTNKDEPPPPIEVLLVSCILFVIIQTLQRKRSMELVQRGLHMLRLWQNSSGGHTSFKHLQNSSEKVESQILESLSRLGLHASIFVEFSAPQMFKDSDATPTPLQIPEQFSQLHEAKQTFDTILADLFISVEGHREKQDVVSSAKLVNEYTGYLDQWWSGFQRLLSVMGPMKDDARCAALTMHVHYHLVRIEASTLPYRDQMLYDNHLDSFRAIVHFSGECLNIIKLSADSCSGGTEDTMPRTTISFGLDPGIISALFWTTLHCRDPQIRRESIGLLHSAHRREGAFDSITGAKVTSKMVDIEESSCPTRPQTCRDIPATARIVFLGGAFHGVDPEKGRPLALDEEVLEARDTNWKGKEILLPAQRMKQVIPYPDNMMICRYVKRPWRQDGEKIEVWVDLNEDIALPGYTQLSPRYDWHPASKQNRGEIELVSSFYRDKRDPEAVADAAREATAALKKGLENEASLPGRGG